MELYALEPFVFYPGDAVAEVRVVRVQGREGEHPFRHDLRGPRKDRPELRRFCGDGADDALFDAVTVHGSKQRRQSAVKVSVYVVLLFPFFQKGGHRPFRNLVRKDMGMEIYDTVHDRGYFKLSSSPFGISGADSGVI